MLDHISLNESVKKMVPVHPWYIRIGVFSGRYTESYRVQCNRIAYIRSPFQNISQIVCHLQVFISSL
jgi:ribosomal protein L21E